MLVAIPEIDKIAPVSHGPTLMQGAAPALQTTMFAGTDDAFGLFEAEPVSAPTGTLVCPVCRAACESQAGLQTYCLGTFQSAVKSRPVVWRR